MRPIFKSRRVGLLSELIRTESDHVPRLCHKKLRLQLSIWRAIKETTR